MHWARRAASRAAWTAGKSNPTKIPMMAMTTSNSTNVNPARTDERRFLQPAYTMSRKPRGSLDTLFSPKRPRKQVFVLVPRLGWDWYNMIGSSPAIWL
jgi:hypothetical protein